MEIKKAKTEKPASLSAAETQMWQDISALLENPNDENAKKKSTESVKAFSAEVDKWVKD